MLQTAEQHADDAARPPGAMPGDADAAQAALDEIPAPAATSAPVEAARAQLHLARQAAKAGPLDALQSRVDADPDDQQARLEYAQALHAAGRVEEAIDLLTAEPE